MRIRHHPTMANKFKEGKLNQTYRLEIFDDNSGIISYEKADPTDGIVFQVGSELLYAITALKNKKKP